jgi:hypothetical protein
MIYHTALVRRKRLRTTEFTYSQESKDVDDQHDVLKYGHSSSTINITEVHDESDGPNHHRALPIRRGVRFLVHVDKRLNHSPDKERTRSSTSLPAHNGHPAGEVAEQFLVIRRSEFRDPICVNFVSSCT